MEFYTLLCELLEKHGPSGDEGPVADFIIQEAKKYCDDVTTDVMGNVIAHKKGSGTKLMYSAHMDSIGFVVTHFEDDGYLRVARIGGISPLEVLYGAVKFKNGLRGALIKEEKVTFGSTKMDNLAIDIGAKTKEEAMKKVMLGDTAVLSVAPMKLEGEESSVVAPYLDNRISCAILLEAMKELKDTTPENDLYFVFSAQEEVGLRGAKPVTFAIDPAYGIVVDVTDVNDVLESERGGTSALGGGAAVKIMDRSFIAHTEVVELLENLAKTNKIKTQRDIINVGGTDGGVMNVSRGGVKTGGISVPCRYIHSPSEMANLEDVKACVALVVAAAKHPLTD